LDCDWSRLVGGSRYGVTRACAMPVCDLCRSAVRRASAGERVPCRGGPARQQGCVRGRARAVGLARLSGRRGAWVLASRGEIELGDSGASAAGLGGASRGRGWWSAVVCLGWPVVGARICLGCCWGR